MQNDFECLGEIDEIEKMIKCKPNMNRFKTLGLSRKKRTRMTEKELFNRRMYRELFGYKLFIH